MKTQLKPGKHAVKIRHEGGPEPVDLHGSARVIPLPALGAEDIISDGRGHVLCGTNDGSIYRIDPEKHRSELLVNTGGRPLGLELLSSGDLVVCDSYKGLLRYPLDSSGRVCGPVEVLAQEVDGRRLRFCSNAAEGPDGSIWFTESTSRFHFPEFMGAILEHSATGSLNRWNSDGTVERVVDKLYFANGLHVASCGERILFCETTDYALRCIHSESRQQHDVATNLPGFPDNMSTPDGNGGVWIAYAHPRSWALDMLAKLPSIVRHIAWNLPDAIRPGPSHDVWATYWVPSESGQWELRKQVRGVHPEFHTATAAVEIGNELILASKDHACLLAVPINH